MWCAWDHFIYKIGQGCMITFLPIIVNINEMKGSIWKILNLMDQ